MSSRERTGNGAGKLTTEKYASIPQETRGVVTLQGKPIVLLGTPVKVGQKAPDFKLLATDMSEVTLADSKGKVRLISVVYSLDTPVCDLQTQWFEAEAGEFKDIAIYTVSMDLPFAQARYCGAHNIKNLRTLSDHREASFGTAYGLLIKGQRMLSRAIFIIDNNDIVRYVEYVPEVGQAPDYDKALAALKKILAE
ncbi:MAG: thiol peroxidase [Dehalococcoidales bacterium]|nr:thiol peroxidase [Dehalococcoidales bacterium]